MAMKMFLKIITMIMQAIALLGGLIGVFVGELIIAVTLDDAFRRSFTWPDLILIISALYVSLLVPASMYYQIFRNLQDAPKEPRLMGIHLLEIVLSYSAMVMGGMGIFYYKDSKSLSWQALFYGGVSLLAWLTSLAIIKKQDQNRSSTNVFGRDEYFSAPVPPVSPAVTALDDPTIKRQPMGTVTKYALIAFGCFTSFIILGGTLAGGGPWLMKAMIIGGVCVWWLVIIYSAIKKVFRKKPPPEQIMVLATEPILPRWPVPIAPAPPARPKPPKIKLDGHMFLAGFMMVYGLIFFLMITAVIETEVDPVRLHQTYRVAAAVEIVLGVIGVIITFLRRRLKRRASKEISYPKSPY